MNFAGWSLPVRENEKTRINARVVPRSSRNRITLEEDGSLKVHLNAPPVDGKANRALISFLASILSLPKKSVILLKGETSRVKVIEIQGLSMDEIRNAIKKS